jgi:general secretion pathway protein A
MYSAYFGLTEPPFSITPDPRYLYMSERHREAMAHLLYGLKEGGGIVQLTGEVGTGKTTLCRGLLEQVPENVDSALILNPQLDAHELLQTVCDEFKVPYPPGSSDKNLRDRLNLQWLRAYAAGRRSVLIVDEAQLLSKEALEQLRLLTNLETHKHKLLHIILIGQPELGALLQRADLLQVAQRVTARYHLAPLSREDTGAYIKHRLAVAGARQALFTRPALHAVYRRSGGTPRLINVICDRALLAAYARSRTRANLASALQAAREVRGARAVSGRGWQFAWPAAVVAGALAFVAIVSWWGVPDRPAGETVANGAAAPAVADVPEPAPPAPVEPQPKADTPPGLTDLLESKLASTGQAESFARLLRLWGDSGAVRDGADPCAYAKTLGIECLKRRGDWRELKGFNRPAILSLHTEDARTHHVLLTALSDSDATIDFGDEPHVLSTAELDAFWSGEYLLLWRAPALKKMRLERNDKGTDVLWVRQALQHALGPDSKIGSTVYDDDLKRRVAAFQRKRGLAENGVVTVETLIHLNSLLGTDGTPTLDRNRTG